jgi:hypothetical protein
LKKVAEHPLKVAGKLFATVSVPCFEVWVLLHFDFSAQAFLQKGKKSPCDQVVEKIGAKGYIANYEKNFAGVYELLRDKRENALKNARQLKNANLKSKNDNPATNVHELVEYLAALKNAKASK